MSKSALEAKRAVALAIFLLMFQMSGGPQHARYPSTVGFRHQAGWLAGAREDPPKFVSAKNPRTLPLNASTLASGQIALCRAIVCFGFAYQQTKKRKKSRLQITVRETSLQKSRNEATFENANRQQPIQLELWPPSRTLFCSSSRPMSLPRRGKRYVLYEAGSGPGSGTRPAYVMLPAG